MKQIDQAEENPPQTVSKPPQGVDLSVAGASCELADQHTQREPVFSCTPRLARSQRLARSPRLACSARLPTARSPRALDELGPASRILNFCAPITNSTLTYVRAQIRAPAKSTAPAFGRRRGPGALMLNLWSEDADGEKLVECRGSLQIGSKALGLIWLGRRRDGTRREQSEWQYVDPNEAAECKKQSVQQNGDKFVATDPRDMPQHSVAQALVGVAAVIAEMFGTKTVQLEAEDNGSGKLVNYYMDLGFEVTDRLWLSNFWGRTKSFKNSKMNVRMESPLKRLTSLAPKVRLECLLPPGFDAMCWLDAL